jgi:HEAT repeat protein
MNADETKRLLDLLINPKAESRKKGFTELKKLAPEKALHLLVQCLQEKNEDIQDDLKKAFYSYKDSALPFLVKAFSHSSWQVRGAASRVIAGLGDGALNRFLELIPKNEEDIDYWMVQTLSLMGGEAVRYLIKAFHHPLPQVRLAALRAAANVKDPSIVEALLTELENDDWPLRKAAFDSLLETHFHNPEAVNRALKSAHREAKYWVIRLASERQDPTLIPIFGAIVEHDAEELKLEAIRALAEIEAKEVQKLLVGYLAHRSWIVRKTAADALWQQNLSVSEELLSAVHGSNIDARYWSVKLLGKTKEPIAFEKIMERLQDSHPSVRAAACQALGTLGEKKALPALMPMLNDPSEEVRTSAILAVSQIGEKDQRLVDKPSIPKHLLAENQAPCSHCGKMVGRNFSFCPFCLGQLKSPTCRQCGRTLEASWKGCPDCGLPS